MSQEKSRAVAVSIKSDEIDFLTTQHTLKTKVKWPKF